MKTLYFATRIDAAPGTVWQKMLSPDGFKLWTSPFAEGSHFEGSWDQGSRMRFLIPSGEGMFSEIVESRPHQYLAIRHLGVVKDGVEETESEQARAWADARENYRLEPDGDATVLKVEADTLPEYERFMQEAWPRALARLKEICEAGAGPARAGR